jgi:hypothetical protein
MYSLKICACWVVILFTLLLHLVATTKNGVASNLYPSGDPIVVLGVLSNGRLELATAAPSLPIFSNNIVGKYRNRNRITDY